MLTTMRSLALKTGRVGMMAGVGVVALLLGAAMLHRGPDLTFAPEMAQAPVALPDGREIYVQRYEVTVAE